MQKKKTAPSLPAPILSFLSLTVMQIFLLRLIQGIKLKAFTRPARSSSAAAAPQATETDVTDTSRSKRRRTDGDGASGDDAMDIDDASRSVCKNRHARVANAHQQAAGGGGEEDEATSVHANDEEDDTQARMSDVNRDAGNGDEDEEDRDWCEDDTDDEGDDDDYDSDWDSDYDDDDDDDEDEDMVEEDDMDEEMEGGEGRMASTNPQQRQSRGRSKQIPTVSAPPAAPEVRSWPCFNRTHSKV